MQKAHKLILVGIGYRPLSARARALVLEAPVILASSRLHEVFTSYGEYEEVKGRVTVIDKVPDTIAFIRERLSGEAGDNDDPKRATIVLLASGDPFFFGIGRRMIEEFGSERVEILPDLSSMQEAFARINLPWDDAFCISVHGGPDIAKRRKLPYVTADIPWLLGKHGKLAILTDRVNNPSVIAGVLLDAPAQRSGEARMYVCERLGYAEERTWSGTAAQARAMTFSEPNVVILHLHEAGERSQGNGIVSFGLRENEISHSRGLITKDEVRAVAIHKLRLPQRGVLWDIGAGSGSVSIEAGRSVPGVKVYAVERDEEQIGHLRTNRAAFDVRNLEIVTGTAPDALTALPAPDRVFIGGSRGSLSRSVRSIGGRMTSGIVVINAATLETLHEAMTALENNGFAVEVSEISVSRSKPVAGKRLMSALNPIYVVTGEKE